MLREVKVYVGADRESASVEFDFDSRIECIHVDFYDALNISSVVNKGLNLLREDYNKFNDELSKAYSLNNSQLSKLVKGVVIDD